MQEFKTILISKIDGKFEGFNDEMLFKLMDGSYWIQDECKYWYHHAYCPEALILENNGRLYIQVDGQNKIVAVRQITNVIKSKINGEFKGWNGETTYKLVNGQVWQQSAYKYEYKYAYMPDALIYDPGGGHVMLVEGTKAKVRRLT